MDPSSFPFMQRGALLKKDDRLSNTGCGIQPVVRFLRKRAAGFFIFRKGLFGIPWNILLYLQSDPYKTHGK
ncbi:hypothetical protein [Paenibacillus chitinolyticus]|uniref:hypothetical protein n=1 Tax=Paenibacillus chitinolyticus TaxID=79263 RepID=UPI00295EA119|nr:hypothetical protein [Paenibacillus chitinolyticus]